MLMSQVKREAPNIWREFSESGIEGNPECTWNNAAVSIASWGLN